MFGNQFFSQIEKGDDLLNGLVLHKRYVLRGSHHGNNYVFLINCQGVKWKVHLNERSSNVWALVGDRWEHFVKQNIDDRVQFIHFIEEGEDIFYVTTYDQAGLENHGYNPRSQMVWRCLQTFRNVSPATAIGIYEENARSQGELKVKAGKLFVITAVAKEDFNVMFFHDDGSALTAVETYTTVVSMNALCHVGDEKDYDQKRMDWYCRWKFHTCNDREDRVFYKKFTTGLHRVGRIKIPSEFVKRQKLGGTAYTSAVLRHKNKAYRFKVHERDGAPKGLEMLSIPSLHKLKNHAGFDNGQMLRFFQCDETSRRDGVLRFEVC
ncbi:DNA-binding pseudobarrel domain-containing protein [Tanacetum coccineum]